MLSQKNRLRNTKEIELVFRKGETVKGGFLLLGFLKNNLRVNRFAFIVSRKVAGKAVQRNKIKRRLREAIRKNLPCLKTGFDFIITARKGIENKDFQEIEKGVEIIFNQKSVVKHHGNHS